MIGHKRGFPRWMACLALAVSLGLAAPAAAGQVVTGSGLIVEKNIAKGLLMLHTGVVLEVGVHTKITSAHGKRIMIGDLVVTCSDGGAVHALDEAMIRYKGTERLGQVSAYSIQVVGKIPR